MFEDTGVAGAAEEGDGYGREKAFIVCSRRVSDLQFLELTRFFPRSFAGLGNRKPQFREVDGCGCGCLSREDVVQETTHPWGAGVVVGLALAPSVAFFEAGLEEEVLAEAFGLFYEGASVSPLEDLGEGLISFEEDRLRNDEILVRVGNFSDVFIRSVGWPLVGAIFGPLESVVDEDFGNLGSS